MRSYSGKDKAKVPYDQKLLTYLPPSPGFFVEAGANNGHFQSNTRLLEEQYQWTGLLVEPNVENYASCIKFRKNAIVERCALVSFDYQSDMIEGDFFDGHPCSSIGGKKMARTKASELKMVPAHTLTSLLEKHKIPSIDFFSLDVEGYELEVLKGLDFARFAPKNLLVEIYHHTYPEIISLLNAKGYRFIENFTTGSFILSKPDLGFHHDYLFIPKF